MLLHAKDEHPVALHLLLLPPRPIVEEQDALVAPLLLLEPPWVQLELLQIKT